MSHSRKHMTHDALTSYPEPNDKERVARVLELRGSNICEIEYEDGERVLCQIPTRFRKLIWIRRGNYVIVKQPSNITNYKVRALVEHVLFPEQIKHLRRISKWPESFGEGQELASESNSSLEGEDREGGEEKNDDEEEDDDLFVNPNHQAVAETSSDEDSQGEIK